jgi:hypothetical protein
LSQNNAKKKNKKNTLLNKMKYQRAAKIIVANYKSSKLFEEASNRYNSQHFIDQLKALSISKVYATRVAALLEESDSIGMILHIDNEEECLIVKKDYLGLHYGLKRDGSTKIFSDKDLEDSSEGLEDMQVELKMAHDESDTEYNQYLGNIGFVKMGTGLAMPALVVPKYWSPLEEITKV